jgi:hypothetical protein
MAAPERLAVYTTWYPGIEPFLPAFVRSLAGQSDADFDLWIGLDGMRRDDAAAALGGREATFVEAPPGASNAEVRQEPIQRIVAGYDAVVFVDSDDVLHPSRVEAARRALEGCDVYGCAQTIIDGDGDDAGIVFGPGETDDAVALLPRYNVFGLSNTAYRTDVLARCLPLPRGCVLIDWQLATRAWLLDASLAFDPTPRMSYRQYGANTARVLPPFTEDDVRAAAARVVGHYRSLPAAPASGRPELEEARERAESFGNFATASPASLTRYVKALNALTPRFVWWWSVANPQLEEIWRSSS